MTTDRTNIDWSHHGRAGAASAILLVLAGGGIHIVAIWRKRFHVEGQMEPIWLIQIMILTLLLVTAHPLFLIVSKPAPASARDLPANALSAATSGIRAVLTSRTTPSTPYQV